MKTLGKRVRGLGQPGLSGGRVEAAEEGKERSGDVILGMAETERAPQGAE